MATTRSTRTTRSRRPKDGDVDDFLGTDNIVPGEVLLTLQPDAAAGMTASVPTHPLGPVLGLSGSLGVDELDSVLADLGAHDITRLAPPAPATYATGALAAYASVEEHPLARTFRVRLAADADVSEAVGRLGQVDSVQVAEPNRYRVSQVVPDDALYSQQWGLPKINAPAAWDRTTGSASVVVGVIDSGVDLTHPELVSLLVPGYDMVDLGPNPVAPAGFRFEGDFSGRDNIPDDEVGHGTHVAGTIAALSNNAAGVAGVTWQCRIMPVKALTRMVRISDGQVRGVGTSADIAAAIRWAADQGASVINMSLGSSSPTTVEQTAVAYAIGKGVVVVAAMGNDGTSNPSYPAAYPDVIAVGATDSADVKASFSQTGAHIDVVAPGVSILSTVPGGGFGVKSGTSMASPHVAGVAALIRSVKSTATVAEVTQILHETARPLRAAASDPVPNDSYGWGLVDAAAAVDRAAPPPVLTARPICDTVPITVLANCQIKTIKIVECLPKTTQLVACQPKTIQLVQCHIKTIKLVECLPQTILPPCLPHTIRCIPNSLACGIQRPLGGQAAHDPYGYLGGGASGADGTEAEAWEAGYAAGYQAALLAVHATQEAAEAEAGEAGGAGDPYGQNPFLGG